MEMAKDNLMQGLNYKAVQHDRTRQIFGDSKLQLLHNKALDQLTKVIIVI